MATGTKISSTLTMYSLVFLVLRTTLYVGLIDILFEALELSPIPWLSNTHLNWMLYSEDFE